MNMTTHLSPQRRRQVLVGLCLIAAPVAQLVGDSYYVIGDFPFAFSLWRWVGHLLFIPALLGLSHYWLRGRADWLGLIGTALVVIGSMGAASLFRIMRLSSVLEVGQNGFPLVAEQAFGRSPGIAASLFLGSLQFPVGLVVLGAGVLRERSLPGFAGILLMACGLLFWLGNAMEIDACLLAGDTLTLSLLGWLGSRLLEGSDHRPPVVEVRAGRISE
ncbi:hypothetical protein [Larkinella soli]|uniref:hypothetical protein n=1 Tax=Larkinella soli TaxID=1770527 RepID=UPI000FFBEABD|nr:hypothetical protein [Larkinella soli]